MSPLTLALCVAAVTFGGAVVGLTLKHMLPDKMTTGAPRDAVASVVGLLTLLCALVLGLLVWTAYGVYSNQNATIQNYALRVLIEDMALKDYGQEADPAREGVLDGLQKTVKQLWGPRFTDDFVTVNYRAAIMAMRSGQFFLDTLQPANDEQKQALAAAVQAQAASAQLRVQMALALTNPVSYPLMTIVVGWVTVLLCGYGSCPGRVPCRSLRSPWDRSRYPAPSIRSSNSAIRTADFSEPRRPRSSD
jgi:uncharacterized membrane protein